MATTGDLIKVRRLINRTTNLRLEDGRRFYGDNEDRKVDPSQAVVSVNELGDQGLKLDIPGRTCATGHRLELELEFRFSAPALRFSAECIVEVVETFQNKCDNVSVRFTRHDSHIWRDLLVRFQGRQSKITELFEKLKGD